MKNKPKFLSFLLLLLGCSNDDCLQQAQSNFIKGNYQSALVAYECVVRNNPEDYIAYNMIGMIYGQMGNSEKVGKYIDTALYINSDYAYANLNKGALAAVDGDTVTALKLLSKAISIDVNYQDAYFNRGILYENLGNYREAIQDLRFSLMLNKEDHAAYYHLGLCLIKLNNRDEACANFTKSLSIFYTDEVKKKKELLCM
ncbi:tetratricopeptide repeat protein [Hymenobacter elongatus]|uniref:Tetratricopeptide repeat protein n=1 Tax=Hymenobacter elongatus TaxID=877208 RepID=A0A4Z0PHU8_9BACT|nr:tetratricopeptide repeat protein [Hymenobacter elongatus]TGE14588.1 tetratricopeptide repeat protein [Hymenobacter elongatus]